MALIYLLRHAHSVANGAGLLAGRAVGNPLSSIGEQQSRAIARALRDEKFAAIYISPLQRCRQTVAPYLEQERRRATKNMNFVEMDYGDWTGRSLADLRRESLWREIQRSPSSVKFPHGESFVGAERRIRRGLAEIETRHHGKKVLVVTHGDIIKIAIQSALGSELDKFQRIVIDPASLSIIDYKTRRVLQVNTALAKRRTKRPLSDRSALGGGSNV